MYPLGGVVAALAHTLPLPVMIVIYRSFSCCLSYFYLSPPFLLFPLILLLPLFYADFILLLFTPKSSSPSLTLPFCLSSSFLSPALRPSPLCPLSGPEVCLSEVCLGTP